MLTAALLHAGWNAVVKASPDQLVSTWAIVAAAAVVNLPVIAMVGLPEPDVWWLVATSSVIHIGYAFVLAEAYVRADLGVAYPIARGTAPLLVTAAGVVLLDDRVGLVGVGGVVLVSIGLVVLATSRPVHATQWALATGIFIAAYTVVDGAGVRANDDSVQYIGAVFVAHGIALTVVVAWRRGMAAMRTGVRRNARQLAVGGLASAGAYLLVMIAAQTEPLGLVAGLRETSALFGLALGYSMLREHVVPRQAIGVGLAVVGAVGIAVG